jgi:hypothetical protein
MDQNLRMRMILAGPFASAGMIAFFAAVRQGEDDKRVENSLV